MEYIVFDLEWNQPFNKKKAVHKPFALYGEIIQIGAVKLDERFHILGTFEILVLPQFYTTMHKKVTRLTKIKTSDLRYGFPFEVAFKYFIKWCGEEFTFLTWGPDDIAVLRDNMLLHSLNPETLPDTYDLQKIFGSQISKEKRQISLSQAMEIVREDGREAHDALNDAWNAARVCTYLNMEKGLRDYWDFSAKTAAGASYPKNRQVSEKRYLTRKEAIKDSFGAEVLCPICAETLTYEDLVRQNSDKYICLGKCCNDDEFFIRFKLSKQQDGKFAASRIIYELSDDNKSYYYEKRQKELDKISRELVAAGVN